MKAAQVLFSQQDNLRSILCQQQVTSDPAASDPCDPGAEEGGDPVGGPHEAMLMQQLMATATQPSPLKAMFHRDEMEAAALAVIQYLTAQSQNPQAMGDATAASGTPGEPRDNTPPPAPNTDVPQTGAEKCDEDKAITQGPQGAEQGAMGAYMSPPTSSVVARLQKVRRSKPATPPPIPIVMQMIEMGFPRKKAEFALKQLGMYWLTG